MARTKDTRIRWNPEEKRRLIEAGRKALGERAMKPLEALEVAQRVLPAARRRQVTYSGKVAWFVKGIGGEGRAAPAANAPSKAARAPRREPASPAPMEGRTHVMGQVKDALVALAVEVLEEALEQVRALKSPPKRKGPSANGARKAKRAKHR